MATHYYKCNISSGAGVNLSAFMTSAQQAAVAAERYAMEAGAQEYIQPVQFFEGGVDFLIFDEEHQPDPRVWKKRTDLGDTPVWEPNCAANHGVVIFDDKKTMPSDTWRRVYERQHLTWEQVKRKFPLAYWLANLRRKPSGDNEADWQLVETAFSSKFFVVFLDFQVEGMHNIPKKKVEYVRQAVMAERNRLALPVVGIDTLYGILQADVTQLKKKKLSTPTFYIYKEDLYIAIGCTCHAEGLVESSEGEFESNKKAALEASNTAQ